MQGVYARICALCVRVLVCACTHLRVRVCTCCAEPSVSDTHHNPTHSRPVPAEATHLTTHAIVTYHAS